MEKWIVGQLPALVSCSIASSLPAVFRCSVFSSVLNSRLRHRVLSVDCGWSSWTQWSACSRTCDVGVRRRYRSGTNPPPAFGGRPCEGDRVGIDTCSVEPCFSETLSCFHFIFEKQIGKVDK